MLSMDGGEEIKVAEFQETSKPVVLVTPSCCSHHSHFFKLLLECFLLALVFMFLKITCQIRKFVTSMELILSSVVPGNGLTSFKRGGN